MEKTFQPLPSDIVCVHDHSFTIDPNYHQHDGCEIFIFLNGDVNYYIEQECYHLQRGNLLMIRPGEYHRVQLNSQIVYERMYINFRTPYFTALSSEQTDLGLCFFQRPFGKQNVALLSEQEILDFMVLFNQMISAQNSNEYGHDLMVQAYSLQILVKINQIFLEASKPIQKSIMPKLVGDTMKYIEEHIAEPITLQDLSDAFYHNGTYISRCFKKEIGISIQEYILLKRIDLAKKYLDEGYQLTDVCWKSGFNNYSNFARTFKKLVGCSPKQYCHKERVLGEPIMEILENEE